jgi:hypothetical protein
MCEGASAGRSRDGEQGVTTVGNGLDGLWENH